MTEDMTPCLHPFDRLELKAIRGPALSSDPVTVECMLCEQYLRLHWPERDV